jgi:hypothetical protein
MGRALGRGTTLTTTEELVFDVKGVSGCLTLIASDPIGLAVIELVVDNEYYKHIFPPRHSAT